MMKFLAVGWVKMMRFVDERTLRRDCFEIGLGNGIQWQRSKRFQHVVWVDVKVLSPNPLLCAFAFVDWESLCT